MHKPRCSRNQISQVLCIRMTFRLKCIDICQTRWTVFCLDFCLLFLRGPLCLLRTHTPLWLSLRLGRSSRPGNVMAMIWQAANSQINSQQLQTYGVQLEGYRWDVISETVGLTTKHVYETPSSLLHCAHIRALQLQDWRRRWIAVAAMAVSLRCDLGSDSHLCASNLAPSWSPPGFPPSPNWLIQSRRTTKVGRDSPPLSLSHGMMARAAKGMFASVVSTCTGQWLDSRWTVGLKLPAHIYGVCSWPINCLNYARMNPPPSPKALFLPAFLFLQSGLESFR